MYALSWGICLVTGEAYETIDVLIADIYIGPTICVVLYIMYPHIIPRPQGAYNLRSLSHMHTYTY